MVADKHQALLRILFVLIVVLLTACASHPALDTTITASTPISNFSEPALVSPATAPAHAIAQTSTPHSTPEVSTASSPAIPVLSDAVSAAPHAACTTTGYKGRIFSIFWSSNSSVLAARSEAGLCLYDVVANQAILSIDSQDIESGAFAPDEQLLAVGYFHSPPQMWNVATGRILYTLETEMKQGRTLTFSPDGRLLAYGEQDNGPDCRVEVWDVIQKRALHTLSEAGCINPMAKVLDFAPDGKTLAVGSNYPRNLVQLWDMTTGQLIRNLPIEGTITDVSFAADGKTLVASSYRYSKYVEGQFVKLWDVATGRELNSLETDASARLGPLSKDQHVLFSQGDSIKLVNLKSPNEIKNLSYQGTAAAVLAPDSRILVFITTDGAATLWDVKTDQSLHTFSTGVGSGHNIFSPDGRLLAVKSSGLMTVKVWDIETGREMFVLER